MGVGAKTPPAAPGLAATFSDRACVAAMSERKRRDGYRQYYEPAKETKTSHLKGTMETVRESPCPRTWSVTRGRPTFHSRDGPDFTCLWMVVACAVRAKLLIGRLDRDESFDLRVPGTPKLAGEPGNGSGWRRRLRRCCPSHIRVFWTGGRPLTPSALRPPLPTRENPPLSCPERGS